MTNKQPNSIDCYVGARIRLRRKMLGMSQTELGEKIGVTFQQIQKYEKGTNRVGASRLQRICGALDAPIVFFFEGQDAELADGLDTAPTLDLFSSPHVVELAQAFNAISDRKVQKKLLDLVKSIAFGDLVDSSKAAEKENYPDAP